MEFFLASINWDTLYKHMHWACRHNASLSYAAATAMLALEISKMISCILSENKEVIKLQAKLFMHLYMSIFKCFHMLRYLYRPGISTVCISHVYTTAIFWRRPM